MQALMASSAGRAARKRSSHAMTPAMPHMCEFGGRAPTIGRRRCPRCAALYVAAYGGSMHRAGWMVVIGMLSVVSVVQAAEPFDKGTWDLELTGSFVTPIRFSEDNF